MRKIDLEDYFVEVPSPEGKMQKVKMNIKDWISNMLFHPDLKLGGREVILRGKLAEKIDKAGKEIILEEVDYQKIKEAFEKFKGFQKVHIELVKRVLDAELIEVEEKKKK